MKTTVTVAGIFAVLCCCQSAAGAAKSPENKAQGSSVDSKLVNSYVDEVNANFAAQDERLRQADELAKKGEVLDAIRIYQDVYFGLTLEMDGRDSWVVKRRVKEIGGRLDALKFEYGNKKLKEADTAIGEKRYNSAITLANDVIRICPELVEQANRIKSQAKIRQDAEERIRKVSPDTLKPELRSDEKRIENYLAEAKVLMKHRQFEDARRKVEEVFKLNPFNQEAAYIVSQIYSEYYTAGYHRSIADVRAMLAAEEWTWVEPTFYQGPAREKNPSVQIHSGGDQAIQKKLDTIVLPEVRFNGLAVSEVLKSLERQSKQYDPARGANMTKEEENNLGVIIDFSVRGNNEAASAGPAKAKTEEAEDATTEVQQQTAVQAPAAEVNELEVRFNVKDATLRDVLDYLSFLTDLPYYVTSERVVFGSKDDDLQTHTFDLSAVALGRISGDDGNSEATAAGGDGGGENQDAAVTQNRSKINIDSEMLKNYFSEHFGINFNTRGSNITYINGKLIMTNTPENISLMRDALDLLNRSKTLVQIELKSIELSEQDQEDLGFEWSLTSGSTTSPNSLQMRDNKIEVGRGQYAALNNPLYFLGEALGESATLIKDLNIFPDIFGSWKPFGIDQSLNLSLTINALDRNTRSESISAPSITVLDSQTASIDLNTSYYFPDSWEDLEFESDDDGDNPNGYTLRPPTPEFGDATSIGTSFKVTPRVKNNIIQLNLNPKITSRGDNDAEQIEVEIQTLDDNNQPIPGASDIRNYEVWKPVIATRNVSLNVNVYDGETLVIAGLANSELETRLDKIPILGDLPLIGRLFQRQSETSKRSNLLFFVTARLISDSGNQVNRIKNSGGIPDVNR